MNDLLNLLPTSPLAIFGAVLALVVVLVLLFGRDRVAGWIAAVYRDHFKGGGSGLPMIAMVLLVGALSACSGAFEESRSSVRNGAGAAEIAATVAKETADAVAGSCAPPEDLREALLEQWVSDGIDWLADVTGLSGATEDLKARHARDCAALETADDQAE